MSGGSYDYAYTRIEQLAWDIRRGAPDNPLRLAFADLLERCAKAAHDIEWVDSCDYGREDDIPAIKAALAPVVVNAVFTRRLRQQCEATLKALDVLEQEHRAADGADTAK